MYKIYIYIFFVRGSIKYTFFITHVSQLPVQPSAPLQMKICDTLHYR